MQKYEIQGVVGEGVYGVVLKCRNKKSGDIVAIKKFKESDNDETVRKNTLREVKILKMMNHPNIVQLKEIFRQKFKLYLVFEFVDRNMLEVLEEKQNGVPLELVKKYIFQLVKAIDHVHDKQCIHRDIKPENLLISFDNSLKLCDFGFARTIPVRQNAMTDYVATRWYRAPELLLSSNNYDKSVDIWAIGCIMAELIDGQPLFSGESDIDQLYIIQKCLGNLTQEQNELFVNNHKFIGYKFPTITQQDSIEKKYLGKLTKSAFNFLKSCLKMEPSERITAADAYQHPWFDDVREQQEFQRNQNQKPLTSNGNRNNYDYILNRISPSNGLITQGSQRFRKSANSQSPDMRKRSQIISNNLIIQKQESQAQQNSVNQDLTQYPAQDVTRQSANICDRNNRNTYNDELNQMNKSIQQKGSYSQDLDQNNKNKNLIIQKIKTKKNPCDYSNDNQFLNQNQVNQQYKRTYNYIMISDIINHSNSSNIQSSYNSNGLCNINSNINPTEIVDSQDSFSRTSISRGVFRSQGPYNRNKKFEKMKNSFKINGA